MPSSDIPTWSNETLVYMFRSVMDTISMTNNLVSLADLSKRAGDMWEELMKRGAEIK